MGTAFLKHGEDGLPRIAETKWPTPRNVALAEDADAIKMALEAKKWVAFFLE